MFPASTPQEEQEFREWQQVFNEVFPVEPRTKQEEAKFEESLKQRYLSKLSMPLLKSEALRVTDNEKWKSVILSIRNLPVQFRVKFIETSQVTAWQSNLEQGIFDEFFIFPKHGKVFYDEIEWLELNASELLGHELEHFSKFMHEIHIMQCNVLPLSLKIRRLFGYYERPDEELWF